MELRTKKKNLLFARKKITKLVMATDATLHQIRKEKKK
jgi:hypothetical protein